MSDDPTGHESEKDDPTGLTEKSKEIIHEVLPARPRMNTDRTDHTDSTAETGASSSDGVEEPDSTSGIERRTYMLMAGGAVAAAVGASGGDTATATSTTEVSQIDTYGYGGGGAVETADMTALAIESTTETLTQTGENDERAEAMQISPGAVVEAELDPATVDWFTFDASDGDPISVQYERSPAVGVTGVIVYGPDGSFKEKLFVGTDSQHQLSTTATASGSHFVQVIDVEAGDGPYTFTAFLKDIESGSGTDDGTTDDGSSDDGSTSTGQSPYSGTPQPIPGRVQAEEFDTGGQEVAYYDTTNENQGGEFRPDELVDIEQSNDSTNEYSVGYTETGEWLEYTVDVTPGTFDIEARVATKIDQPEVALTLGGETLGTMQVPTTGGWYTWEKTTLEDVTVSQGGEQILRVEFLDSGTNLNWIRFIERTDDEYGMQAYGEYEYGGISQ